MHEPAYYFTGRSHYAVCSCGWRSPLNAVLTVITTAFAKHLEES
jgi:hypothetical protein